MAPAPAPLETHLESLLLRQFKSPSRSVGARARACARMREELYRSGPTPDEAELLADGGRAGAGQALALRVERALVAGALELDELGEWRPTEVRIDADADCSSTRGTAGTRDLLVLTRAEGESIRTIGGASGGLDGTRDVDAGTLTGSSKVSAADPTLETGGAPAPGVMSLRTLAMTFEESLAEEQRQAWVESAVARQLDSGATLVAVDDDATLDAVAGQAPVGKIRLLALGAAFDEAIAPVSKALLGSEGDLGPAKRLPRALVSTSTTVDVGDTLDGKFELVEKLGQGGFGAVYRAIDRDLDTEVAVKLLRAELASQESALDEFRAEARRVAKLEHPNIVGWKGFNAGSESGPYFVMEFLRGTELVNSMRSEGALDLERAKTVMHQVLQALVAAHYPASGEQVLHLDLKPQNIFLTTAADGSEQAKVIDFGIGRLTGRGGEQRGPAGEPTLEEHADARTPGATISITHRGSGSTGSVACTPEYASPEQARNMQAKAEVVPLDDRSDLYSFGVLAFELLSGDLPFPRLPRDARLKYLDYHQRETPRRLRDLNGDIPRPLAEFVERCLAKSPTERFASSREALVAFEALLNAKRNTALIAVVAVAVAVIGALSVMLANRDGGSVETLQLSVAQQAVGDTLYLGAGSDQVVELGRSFDARAGLPLFLVDDAARDTYRGWRIETLEGRDDAVRVIAPEVERSEAFTGAIGFTTPTGRFESLPLDFVALGDGAVRFAGMRVGAREVQQGDRLRLVPDRLRLEIQLDGQSDHVQRLEVGNGTLVLASENRIDTATGNPIYDVALGSLQLPVGATEVALQVTDAADVTRTLGTLTLDRLPSLPLRNVELAGERNPQRPLLLRPGADGLPPRDVVVRAAEGLDVEIVVQPESGGRETLAVRREAPDRVRAELPESLFRGGDGALLSAFVGQVEARIGYGEDVIRAAGSSQWTDRRVAEFRFEPDAPEIAVAIDGATAIDGTLVVADAAARVVVSLGNRTPAEIEARLLDANGAALDAERHAISMGDPLIWGVSLAADGVYSIEVIELREDTAGEVVTTPLCEPRRVVRLAEAPRAALSFGELTVDDDGVLAVDGDIGWPPLVAELADAVPVDVDFEARVGAFRWSGRVPAGEREVELRLVDEDDAEGLLQLADGTYSVRLAANDPFGREIVGEDYAFELARFDPTATLITPRGSATVWNGDGAQFVLRFNVADGNGIDADSVSVVIEARDGSGLTRDVPVEVTRRESDVDLDFSATVELSHFWSGREVAILLDARDRRGGTLERRELRQNVRLSEIVRTVPAWVELVDASVPDTTPMRRMRHGARGRYVYAKGFGRTTDALEHEVPEDQFEPYYLDTHEVTTAQFLAFLEHPSGFVDASHWPAVPAWARPEAAPTEARRLELLRTVDELGADRTPMVGVRWVEAYAYADFVGKRLQSALEWEWAVRGASDGRRWSAEEVTGAWTTVLQRGQNRVGADLEVDDYVDRTPEGLLGLCTGALEWTATPWYFDGGDRRAYDRSRSNALRDPDNHAHFTSPWGRTHDRDFVVAGVTSSTEPTYLDVIVGPTARATFRNLDQVGFRCSLSLSRYEELARSGLARPHDPRTAVEASAPTDAAAPLAPTGGGD